MDELPLEIDGAAPLDTESSSWRTGTVFLLESELNDGDGREYSALGIPDTFEEPETVFGPKTEADEVGASVVTEDIRADIQTGVSLDDGGGVELSASETVVSFES